MSAHSLYALHENVPNIWVDESEFYTDPDVIYEPELFNDEIPQWEAQPAVVTSNSEDSDTENPQEILLPLESETPQ